MKCIIYRLYSDSFDFSRWRAGIAIWTEIGVSCRKSDIFDKKNVLQKYAVGYIPADRLICRPKPTEIAVMFLINGEFCWTHFSEEEFINVFFE